ncbi:MAG TPA: glycosyltransferase [Candidatus Sulfotelmatobacter sp.]
MLEEVSIQERSAAIHSDVPSGEEGFLADDFVSQLINVGETDLLIGLPTYNNAKTIGSVVSAIQSGILQSFPRDRAAIINADGGSRDGTPELIVSASIDDVRRRDSNRFALRTLHSISTQYGSTAARGTALRTILAAGELLRAQAVAVISPDSTNINPDWLRALLKPAAKENFDLVLPTYARHKFDGLLITNLLYPLTRAIYGLRIREPYASEFAFSGGLGSRFLTQAAWNDEAAKAGSEVQFTVNAITGGCRICQVFLGAKKHAERHAADLIPALRQTVGVLFCALESDFPWWSTKTGSQPVPTSGPEQEFILDPQRVNRKRLLEIFRSGINDLQSVFQTILASETLAELQEIAALDEDDFRYSESLWVRTIYEFASAHHQAVINRDHIVQALAPLFRGRVLSFLLQNRVASASDVEARIENLCLEFERQKPYLLKMWTGKE